MKYLIHVQIDAKIGNRVEEDPAQLEEFLGAWQALDPEAFYLGAVRREAVIVVDAKSEDAFLEPLRRTWLVTGSYPEVRPVVPVDQAPALMQRLGIT